MPHTEPFLTEMKQALEAEQTQLKGDLSEATDNFPEYGRNEEDNATEVADYQTSTAANKTQQERLDNVTAALERIKAGNYGVTDDGNPIPEDRLRANPAATTIIK